MTDKSSDYNNPVVMFISGHLKFEATLIGKVTITDLLQDKRYVIIPPEHEHAPFDLLEVKEGD